jgi:hypothetical protein
VELGGTNELHAAFLTESHTRDSGWSILQEIRVSRSFFARCGIPQSYTQNRSSPPRACGQHQWYPTSREKRARYGAPGFVAVRETSMMAPFHAPVGRQSRWMTVRKAAWSSLTPRTLTGNPGERGPPVVHLARVGGAIRSRNHSTFRPMQASKKIIEPRCLGSKRKLSSRL